MTTLSFGNDDSYRPDLMVLGFQEIVPLTAQQIVQTDPEKKYDAYSSCFSIITHVLLTDAYGKTKSSRL